VWLHVGRTWLHTWLHTYGKGSEKAAVREIPAALRSSRPIRRSPIGAADRLASRVMPSWHARIVARTQAVYYRDPRGGEPVDDFIQALPSKRAAKIDDFVEEYLNGQPPEAPPPPFPITSQIDGELRELRVRFGNTRYRILYQRSENLVVLLHALEKDTEAVSQADIELAKQRMADFKRRMDALRRRPPRAAGKDAPPPSRPV
jgi:phage-related protein